MEPVVRNPFDFVPYPNNVPRGAPLTHERTQGRAGALLCELEALSPFLVMDSERRAGSSRFEIGTFQQTRSGRYVIPGTSLKGAIRSAFEVLTHSCVSMSTPATKGYIPPGATKCRTSASLCAACRTFGFLSGGDVYRGPVNIGEAVLQGPARVTSDMQLVPLFSPKPRSNPAYANGRKFYFHQLEPSLAANENERSRGPWVQPLEGRQNGEAGATFRFEVRFDGLRDEDLQALVTALVLFDEAPLQGRTTRVRHKLGYGKPAGLGSVEIRIRQARLAPPPADRYTRLSAEPDVLDGAALAQWIDAQRAPFQTAPSPSVQKLVEILRYPPQAGVRYAYPVFAE